VWTLKPCPIFYELIPRSNDGAGNKYSLRFIKAKVFFEHVREITFQALLHKYYRGLKYPNDHSLQSRQLVNNRSHKNSRYLKINIDGLHVHFKRIAFHFQREKTGMATLPYIVMCFFMTRVLSEKSAVR
jgi:hypothetical protein